MNLFYRLEKEHEKSDYAWHDWILILCFIINAGNLLALNGLYLCYRMRKRHITNGIEATMVSRMFYMFLTCFMRQLVS